MKPELWGFDRTVICSIINGSKNSTVGANSSSGCCISALMWTINLIEGKKSFWEEMHYYIGGLSGSCNALFSLPKLKQCSNILTV